MAAPIGPWAHAAPLQRPGGGLRLACRRLLGNNLLAVVVGGVDRQVPCPT